MVDNSLENIFLILSTFCLFVIKQNPTPQLNVLSISASLILFFLSHLKIDLVLIFDKSIFKQFVRNNSN